MTKKVKPAKKAKKPADKTPEITKAAKALENYLKENNLDPAKDWSKDKTHGKAVKELMAKLNKERDKVAAQYPEKDTANQKKLVKMKKASEDEKKAKKEAKAKEKKEKASSGRTATKYDYPLVNGREMTSEEKKKYRMAQRKLAAGKTPKESKPKEEPKKPKEEPKKESKKDKPSKKDKKAKDSKKKKAKDED